ncbi:SGNH/GDSL hydrolase family protein [Paenibacillus gansuensis]|uniref:SGNH/GDSL hydrolase family protein n=1 Tax=Paenibacillus gansuensis TaxID=306542 RepID=A0ABW5PHK1_9BACL
MLMIYTALGDSITFGENASAWKKAYPQAAVSMLNSESRKAHGLVLARRGWSSYDLLDAVIWKGSPVLGRSSVVTVWIGGIDLVNAALTLARSKQSQAAAGAINSYKRNLGAILTHIRKESRARIVCCTQYNPFPNSPVAAESIARLNGVVHEVSHQFGAAVAPSHAWFEGKQADLIYGYRTGKIEYALSGSYPIHPNDRGHQVIARGLVPYLAARR